MPKITIEGTEVELPANGILTKEQFNLIQELKTSSEEKRNPSNVKDSEIDPQTGYYNLPEVNSKIRFAVSAAPNFESKVKTLQKFFSKVIQDEYDPTNFILEDSNGKRYILDDKTKTNFGDVIDEGKIVPQMVLSTAGTIAGSAGGPAGAIAGSGGGLALGSEFYERVGQLFGTEIERTPGEYLKTRGMEVVFGAGAQAAGPLLLKGIKNIFRGGEGTVYKEAAEQMGLKNAAEGKKYYDSLTLQQRIDSGLKLNMADRLVLADKYGTNLTLGQATENGFVDTFEGVFANVPFASGMMRRAAERSQDALGKSYVKNMITSLEVPRLATRQQAGEVVGRGIVGKGDKLAIGDAEFGITQATGAIQRFRNESAFNFGKVNESIKGLTAAEKGIQMNKTLEFLREQAQSPQGIQALYKIINNPQINTMFKTLDAITKKGTKAVPYEAVDKLRQLIGTKLSDPVLFDSMPRSVFKAMYKNVMDDITTSLGKITGTQGRLVRANLKTANDAYKQGIDTIDKFLNPLAKKVGDLDGLVNKLLTQAKQGGTQLNKLMNSLGPERSKVLISSIVEKLGEAEAIGAAGALGRTNFFNTSTFLTNYGKLAPEAKQALFNNPMFKGKNYGTLNNSIKEIQTLSTYIEGGNPFKDLGQLGASRQAGTGLLIGAGAGGFGALLGYGAGGGLGAALGFIAGIPLFGITGGTAARLMSNPAFMHWVARGIKIAGNKGIDGLVEHTVKLGAIAGNSDKETGDLINQYLEIMKRTAAKNQQTELRQATNQQAAAANQQPRGASPSSVASTTPVNTQVTDPMQYASLFPQDTLGQAIAQRKVI